ncbi:hypothetical protein [Corallococcus carmarthensis]|uniref:hypothetical protein n=1 Tax=Corallococcus carmarthensis TaxID=2316728 RepID=UPI00148C47D9|nr:hypothetical protein [Corallococcus carmarthensis]NOK19870.1 hypothetical protein [Corallococcus carmarthensis]
MSGEGGDTPTLDPGVRTLVTDLLYSHLPALYRVVDMAEGTREPRKSLAPKGVEELYKFLRILAAPIARTRQNIEELHADLFIDKSADWILPYLADMIGMRLVFPEAPSNRRDVRGTVGWRRRKGTPSMLEEMAGDLSGQLAVSREGWKRILLAQDLDLYRPERTIAGLGPATVAERASGPLDTSFHAVDPRRIGRTTGRYHPKHVAHWLYPTKLFPVTEGTARDRTLYDGGGAPKVDYRFAFNPLGADVPLRVRRASAEDRLAGDRVPPLHFAARPGDYFDQEGGSGARFTVRFTGLPAAVATASKEARASIRLPAERALAADLCDVLLLSHVAERLSSPVRVGVMAVPLTGADANVPNTAAGVLRGEVRIEARGGTSSLGVAGPVAGPYAVMLRLVADGGAGYFPGAVIEVACRAPSAAMPPSDQRLAAMGFLAGALAVELPATWVVGERWLFVAADGSVYDADPPGTALAVTPQGLRLPGEALSAGPGPAWPPLPLTSEPEPWRGIPSATARGPVVVHGPRALDVSGAPATAGNTVALRLVFALRVKNLIRPFLQLAWTGSDPTAVTAWKAFKEDGTHVTSAAELRAAWAFFARETAASRDDAELWLRLESDTQRILLPSCEVSFTSDQAEAVLIHLPALETKVPPLAGWSPSLAFASEAVSVRLDGSTVWAGSLQVARFACGAITPIREAKTLRRRQLRQRTLCWWKNEDPMNPQLGLATPAGFLDIDPAHGLFSFAKTEPAAPFTVASVHTGAVGWPPRPVTVDYLEGYSFHTGARPDAREPLLAAELLAPTRLVLGGGSLHRGAPLSYQALPRYSTLGEALAAVVADGVKAAEHEVIQLEDSATYAESALVWPANVKSLTVQAAELHRPVLLLGAAWSSGAPPAYEKLTLHGLAIRQTTYPGAPPVPATLALDLPPATEVEVRFCTALTPHDLWRFTAASGSDTAIRLFRCLAPRLQVNGAATVMVEESVLDAAGGAAVQAIDSEVRFERSTVVALRADLGGAPAVDVRVIEASESLFTDVARARDRFHGCVRYSRVEPESLLPRRHRVTEDIPLFVTRDRTDAAHLRLSEECPRTIARGAEDGSEMGAFHGARFAQRGDALLTRLIEYTPAGLQTGLLRMD